MKSLKSLLLPFFLLIIMPLMLAIISGFMRLETDVWGERPEHAEMHMYRRWQYIFFFITLAVLTLFEFFLICRYWIKSKHYLLCKFLIVCVAWFIWLFLTTIILFEIPMQNFFSDFDYFSLAFPKKVLPLPYE